MALLKRFAREEILQNMPYATSELSEVCSRCDTQVCLTHCPEGIITLNPDKLPTLDFLSSGCVFCEECVNACFEHNGEHRGFSKEREQTQVVMKIAPNSCLAWNKFICYSCKDVCPKEIRYLGMFYPEIISCNGCGLCISRCPSNAIKMERI